MFFYLSKFSSLLIILSRFIRKKALSYFPPSTIELRYSDQRFWVQNPIASDFTEGWLLNPGIWERNELTAFGEMAKKANVIFDIGANLGVYSILASKKNPDAEIFAFEPYSPNFEMLRSNVARNDCSNIECIETALGIEDGNIEFYVPSDEKKITSVASTNLGFTSGFENPGDLRKISVPQRSLASFIESRELSRVDLMKLDVEYHELEVLKGGEDWLKRFMPVIFCEVSVYDVLVANHPGMKDKVDPELSHRLESFLKGLGYTFYAIGVSGLMRTCTLHNHPDNRNFVLSGYSSNESFVPYSSDLIWNLLPHGGSDLST